MDFRGQGNHAPAGQSPQQQGGVFATSAARAKKGIKQPVGKVFNVGSIILLFAVAALVLALTFFLIFGKSGSASQVDGDKYQAVFLNNGQVYFGKIKNFGRESVDLREIYYLQTSNTESGSSTPQNVSLVKLGCELHAPVDQMLINTDQVIFWENLTDGGQVVEAIDKYKSENGGKLNCTQQSQSSTDQAPADSTTTTTPATTTPTTKKP